MAYTDGGLQSGCTDTWHQLATAAIAQLSAACKSQPDPRRVYKTVVTRLLAPILKLEIEPGVFFCAGGYSATTPGTGQETWSSVYPMHASTGLKARGPAEATAKAWGCAGEGAAGGSGWRALVHAARQLLDAVVFGRDHIGHIQELAIASWTGMSQGGAATGEAGAEGALPVLRAPRHGKYAALPFEVSELLPAVPVMPSALWSHAFHTSEGQGSSLRLRLYTADALCRDVHHVI